MKNYTKYISLLMMALIFIVGRSKGQVFKTSNGKILFVSKTDFETFDATNNKVIAAVTSSGKIQFRVPINAFIFDQALMQTHFQENYMESSKYANASFKGGVVDPEGFKLSSKVQQVKVAGVFNIHGVDKEEEVTGTLQKTKNGVELKAKFSIQISDYGIEIPKNNINDISNVINIEVDCKLTPKKKKK